MSEQTLLRYIANDKAVFDRERFNVDSHHKPIRGCAFCKYGMIAVCRSDNDAKIIAKALNEAIYP